MEYALEIESLRKEYQGFTLQDISFKLPCGYIMGLIGPNGSGKTTTIKLIMNLLQRNGGQVKVFGQEIMEHEIESKDRIGFVYDDPNFYDHLTLTQMKKIIAPFYRNWDESEFRKKIERFELPADKKIKTLSRGMKMKYALALALSHHADLFILDEPTSGLDPVFRRELLEILHELIQDESKAVLFSTHVTTDLERIGDFITFIHKGVLVFSSSKEEIFENFALVKGGKEMFQEVDTGAFLGIRENQYGIEALTDQAQEIKKKYAATLVIEKASLEDIMFLMGKKRGNQ